MDRCFDISINRLIVISGPYSNNLSGNISSFGHSVVRSSVVRHSVSIQSLFLVPCSLFPRSSGIVLLRKHPTTYSIASFSSSIVLYCVLYIGSMYGL